MRESETIAADFSCVGCNYNLRGLSELGRCPECGMSITQSLFIRKNREIERRIQDPLWQADPRWVRQLTDGVMAALGAMCIRLTLILAPDQIWTKRSFVLSALAVAFVLDGFACWRLTTPEPGRSPLRRSRLVLTTRVLGTAYFCGFLIRDTTPVVAMITLAVALVLGGVAASLLIYICMGQIAGRIWRFMPVQAYLLAVLAPLWFFSAIMPQLDASPDSVSTMLRAPTLFAGNTETLELLRGYAPRVWICVGLLLPAGAFLFHCQMLAGLIYVRRKQLNAMKACA